MPRVAILTTAVDSAPTAQAGCQECCSCTQELRHKLGTELKIKHDLSWNRILPSQVRFQRKVWLYTGHQQPIPLGISQH